MRIPDGDLMPARRHKYRGSYGRRRSRSRGMAVVLLLLVVAGGTAWYLRRDDLPSGGNDALASCPTPTPSHTASPAPLPPSSAVRLVLLNGTPRNGLAEQVGTQLEALHFRVLRKDNAPAALAGASVVSYGRGAEGGATLLGRYVLGSRVDAAPTLRPGALQVVLGSSFRRLATPAEVTAAGASGGRAVVPAPTATGTRGPCAH